MELVEAEWAGSKRRPLLRLRVDFPDSAPGRGVTVEDCARVSRRLEEWLDEHPALPERYVLEVSSPGVERPLTRLRHFRRFAGEEVRVRGPSSTVEGTLEGAEADGEAYRVTVRLPDGSQARFASDEIVRATLVFRWDQDE